jgi:hypothetical protein
MHWGLPWFCSWSPASTGAGSGGSSSPCSVWPIAICKYETLHKCNTWGAKSGKLHAHAQLTHGNPCEPFTNLPIAFLAF